MNYFWGIISGKSVVLDFLEPKWHVVSQWDLGKVTRRTGWAPTLNRNLVSTYFRREIWETWHPRRTKSSCETHVLRIKDKGQWDPTWQRHLYNTIILFKHWLWHPPHFEEDIYHTIVNNTYLSLDFSTRHVAKWNRILV